LLNLRTVVIRPQSRADTPEARPIVKPQVRAVRGKKPLPTPLDKSPAWQVTAILANKRLFNLFSCLTKAKRQYNTLYSYKENDHEKTSCT
jgi:hypothetical protein